MSPHTLAQTQRPERHGSTLSNAGKVCSIIGLAAWTVAILAALAQPLFGLQLPAEWVLGLAGGSALFTMVAMPQLLRESASPSASGKTRASTTIDPSGRAGQTIASKAG